MNDAVRRLGGRIGLPEFLDARIDIFEEERVFRADLGLGGVVELVDEPQVAVEVGVVGSGVHGITPFGLGLGLDAGDDPVEDPGPGAAREAGKVGVGRGIPGPVRGGFEERAGAGRGSEHGEGGYGEKAESEEVLARARRGFHGDEHEGIGLGGIV